MKIKLIKNFTSVLLLMFVFPFLSFSQWNTSTGQLSSSDRVIINGSGQQAATENKRMSIVTDSDRIGLYIENKTTSSTGTPPWNPADLCLPYGGNTNSQDYYFGLYVASPLSNGTGGYAGWFDGYVGICGGLELQNQEFNNTWNIVDLYGDGLSFIGSSSGGSGFKLLRSPTANDACANIIVNDGNNKALEVFRGDALSQTGLGTSKFFVTGLGRIDTQYGLRITTSSNEWRPIEMLSDVDDSRLFYVTKQGTVVSTKGFEIVDPEDNNVRQFKIEADGHLTAREIRVTLNPIPDYVFEPDYDLKTLEELEAYIAENKHLPNIPSAKEIKENGIGLGDLQVRELEKIEELTLYILQLNKRLEKLEKENEILKANNKK